MTKQERGKLTIFLSYAAGTGKTYKMLEEACASKAEGVDVVIGYFEPHERGETIEKTVGLEIIPRKKIAYHGTIFEEMDTEAILARRPRLCVVDELPHTNVPGSARMKRWEDVAVLLANNIDVFTDMNIQHLESLNGRVRQITGIQVRETVPDQVLHRADDIVIVDLTPRALLHRLRRGVVYPSREAGRALQNFFRAPVLAALRELALRQAVYESQRRTLRREEVTPSMAGNSRRPRKHHKILIPITANPRTAMLLRRARRISDLTGAECVAVTIQRTGQFRHLPRRERGSIQQHLTFARNLGIETRVLENDNVANALIEFAWLNQVTQIYLPRPRHQTWMGHFRGDLTEEILTIASDIQIVIVSDRASAGAHDEY